MTDFTLNAKKTTDLKQFESEDGIKFALDKSGGVFYLGWNALAQVCSIGLSEPIFAKQVRQVIEIYLSKGATVETPFEAEVETPNGLESVTLISRELGVQAIKQYNPNLYEEMADAGHFAYLNQLLGRSWS